MILQNPAILEFLENEFRKNADRQAIGIKTFKPGQSIVIQDKNVQCVYIIREGICKCFISEENSRTLIIGFLGRGEIIGEIELLLDKPAIAGISALTEVNCFSVDKKYFKDLLSTNTRFNQLLLVELAARIQQTATCSAAQQLNTLEDSLQKIIALLQQEKIPLSKKDLADYLGTTVRSVNRGLKELGMNIPR